VILLRVIFMVACYHNRITVTVFCVIMIIMKPNFSSCYNQDAGKPAGVRGNCQEQPCTCGCPGQVNNLAPFQTNNL